MWTRRPSRLYWLTLLLACAVPATALAGADDRPVVLFVGTSLTAGYGLPSDEAYPALLQERIDAAGLSFRVVNAGVSGDTSAGGLRRIDWLLKLPVSILFLELGANDMLRGLSPSQMRANLQAIFDRTRATHPRARFVLAGMRALRNLGAPFVAEFEAAFAALAETNDAVFLPFLLEGVAGERSLNQADDIHPNAEGQRRIADLVWPILEPLLRDPQDTGPPDRPRAPGRPTGSISRSGPGDTR